MHKRAIRLASPNTIRFNARQGRDSFAPPGTLPPHGACPPTDYTPGQPRLVAPLRALPGQGSTRLPCGVVRLRPGDRRARRVRPPLLSPWPTSWSRYDGGSSGVPLAVQPVDLPVLKRRWRHDEPEARGDARGRVLTVMSTPPSAVSRTASAARGARPAMSCFSISLLPGARTGIPVLKKPGALRSSPQPPMPAGAFGAGGSSSTNSMQGRPSGS